MKVEDWLDDLHTVASYAKEQADKAIMSVPVPGFIKEAPIVKAAGEVLANPTKQTLGTQATNLGEALYEGVKEEFSKSPEELVMNWGPAGIGGFGHAIGAMTAYHGGAAIQEINLNKSRYNKTFYASDNPIYAKSYGGDKSVLNEVEISDNAKLADMIKPTEDLIHKISQATGEDFYPYTKKTVIDGIAAGKAHFAEMPAVKKVLKNLGYDGQITSEVPFAKNIGVWNKEVIGKINVVDFLDK